MEADKRLTLPPGLCFDPTDEELILYFLYQKAASLPCYPDVIPDLDLLYSPHPWELDDKAFVSRRKWYFFSRKMENRGAEKGGFWKEIGVDEPIVTHTGNKVGIKKYLVFYGTDHDVSSQSQTNWIMEEYHLLISPGGENQDLDEWVLCRVHEANMSNYEGMSLPESDNGGDELSYLDEVFLSMEDDEEEINFPYY